MKPERFFPAVKALKVPVLTLVVVTIILLPKIAEAKVVGYVSQGGDDELYEFDYPELVQSFIFGSPLYLEFSKGEGKYLLDDINGYVDYHKTVEAFVFSGDSFDLDEYTSGPDAKIVDVDMVTVVTEEDGKLKFEEKFIGDAEEIVLNEVNAAASATDLRAVLERRAQVVDLDLYNKLTESAKAKAVENIFARRDDGFADIQQLNSVINEEVDKLLSSTGEVLDLINSADNEEQLEELLIEYAGVLEVEIEVYHRIIASRQQQMLAEMFKALPYDSPSSLSDDFNQRASSTLTSYVLVSHSNYDYTVADMLDIQMGLTPPPQWWSAGGWADAPRKEVRPYIDPATYVPSSMGENVTEIIVNEVLRVRAEPTTESEQVATVQPGQAFMVQDVANVLEGTSLDSRGFWFKIKVGSDTGWVTGNYADWVVENYQNPRGMFQFLTLSGSSGVTVGSLGNILDGQGILSGTEEVFYQASQENNINEVFLTSLALHETGNGSSTLANGYLYTPDEGEPRVVYNMFGIGAVDSSPNLKGAEYAYNEGWFSPEKAIIGGAYFASRNYVNNSNYYQDTLYKMRWNPGSPGKHQYATDINWPFAQTSRINQLYQQISVYDLRFDIPRYRPE